MPTGLPGVTQLRTDMAALLRAGTLDTLLVFDIDNFHRLNTDLGYKKGDQVLALIEGVVSEGRGSGYRIGGDHFGILGAAGEIDAEQLRGTVALMSERRLGVCVTLSGGAVRAHPAVLGDPNASVDILYAAASELLALAKQLGRDRVLWLTNEDEAGPDVLRVATRMYRRLAEASAARSRQMETESRIDALTGLYNRRGFDDVFGRMAEASQRRGSPLTLIYMDSDSLKEINDSGGHEAGDRFIVDLASILRSTVRGSDSVFRWGSDEFAVVLEQADAPRALSLAERIRQAVAERTEGTVSIGIYSGVPEGPEAAVREADKAMYSAKGQGKDRIVVAVEESTTPAGVSERRRVSRDASSE